ncbi:phospholipid phosphatase 5 [Frankliniella occidentalis]|uniref:Phospholipid phosphatase 5 n=1 Tax=Frankliniella occidentalis TaxID=133901 RepID=A0A6J1RV95_FRAOC|nr:phospholipid phosphatase 5 [Frankliniella occidentalis]XP_052132330.1 phospholipid phosphatase 5 [Frankliniella occidentalis]
MNNVLGEVLIRLVIGVIALYFDKVRPFTRKIQPDELWLYKNPRTDSYVTTTTLWIMSLGIPTAVILCVSFAKRKQSDALQGFLACSLGCVLNALLTNIIKVIVGRPRPDFFWRCYPDGVVSSNLSCTGDMNVVQEGRKSFPSGHSSWAFAGLGFLALYIAGKLHTFSREGKAHAWKLVAPLAPLCSALMIALSRTCDYHHHWQDVACGSALGLFCAYISYCHYYPKLSSPVSDQPLVDIPIRTTSSMEGVSVKTI